eukprot:COSAG01_NODE_1995_length_8691_cov_62.212989_11_plen_488_part_00
MALLRAPFGAGQPLPPPPPRHQTPRRGGSVGRGGVSSGRPTRVHDMLLVAKTAVLFAAVVAAPAARYTLQHLQVEHLHEPSRGTDDTLLAIDVAQPRLSWRLEPTHPRQRGVSQSAYQLHVMAGGKTIWDSKRVDSNSTSLVKCCGTHVMQSDTLYRWNITSWDTQQAVAHASASFHTGLFHRQDWEPGVWITPGLTRNLLRSPALHVPSQVASASVFVAGVGYFELTVNGKRVGAGRKFDVGWTEYAKRVNYVAFDLAPFLVVGENRLGVVLGNSWYQDQGWYRLPPYYYEDRGMTKTRGCIASMRPKTGHGVGGGTCNGGGFAYPNPNQLLLRARVQLSSGGGGDQLWKHRAVDCRGRTDHVRLDLRRRALRRAAGAAGLGRAVVHAGRGNGPSWVGSCDCGRGCRQYHGQRNPLSTAVPSPELKYVGQNSGLTETDLRCVITMLILCDGAGTNRSVWLQKRARAPLGSARTAPSSSTLALTWSG